MNSIPEEQIIARIKIAAWVMGVSYSDILINSHCPHKNNDKIGDTRQAIMYCLANFLELSHKKSGEFLSRSSQAVTHAMRRIEDEQHLYKKYKYKGSRMSVIEEIQYIFNDK